MNTIRTWDQTLLSLFSREIVVLSEPDHGYETHWKNGVNSSIPDLIAYMILKGYFFNLIVRL